MSIIYSKFKGKVNLLLVKFQSIVCCIIIVLALQSCQTNNENKHLFILSGQSNMVGLNPEDGFIPTIETAWGKDKFVLVKSAYGGQPIKRWYKEWNNPTDSLLDNHADLYDSLMVKVNSALLQQPFANVTFIWMQGERDAREGWGDIYQQSLSGLYQQLSQDLNRNDLSFVIGRLSDFDLSNSKYPHWTKVREAQVNFANTNPRFSWIDTDDLNDGVNSHGKQIKNDLHMSVEGYKIMGQRFAEAAIDLIKIQH